MGLEKPGRRTGRRSRTQTPSGSANALPQLKPIVLRASKVNINEATGVGHRDPSGDYVFVGVDDYALLDYVKRGGARTAQALSRDVTSVLLGIVEKYKTRFQDLGIAKAKSE